MPPPEAATPAVTVRMYRQGLGDCFLLTFVGQERPVHLLIDCGAVVGAPDAAARINQVAADIRDTTGGRLDVVVATHEHWDHVSGFEQAKEIFEEQLTVDEIWLAWTEEPGNTVAAQLKEELGIQRQAVAQALQRWAAAGIQPRLYAAVTEVVSFLGDVLGAGATTKDAFARLTGREGAAFRYLTPGQTPFAIPGVEGVRVYVLGPPSDPAFLRKLLPKEASEEAYEMSLTPTRAFLAAVEPAGSGAEADERRRRALPFDEYYMVSRAEAERRPDDFFRRHYGFAADDSRAWRRIDEDWLTVAGQLALDLDNRTNNTCLVLAFEIVATGDVLLFPGDAQIGNWASWKNVTFTVPAGANGEKPVRSKDLLARTVLYKVGHHASHNATHRAEGLELMESPELVAMIPVNHETAKKKHWNMPFPPLLARLTEKCRGRVIRQDDAPGAAVTAAAGLLPAPQAKRFKDRVRESELFVECDFPG